MVGQYNLSRFERLAGITVLCAALGSLGSFPITAQEPQLPSPYGPDDTLGAVNNLSAEIVREAAGLVRDGKVYSLAIPTGPDTPAFGTRNYQVQVSRIYTDEGVVRGSNRANGNDDLLISWLGIGTQIDGFAHAGVDSHHYNNVPIEDVLRPDGVIRYSIHEVPPIVTRGVLLDIAADLGTDPVPGGTAINRPELESAMARQGTEIRRGDVVLLHTGSLQLIDSDPARFMASVAGLGVDGAEYLAGLGVVAVGIDTWALDVIPGENADERLPVHSALLVRHGVHILENIRTGELARDGAHEFLFVLAAPRFVGAVQSPVHPVAIR